MQKDLSDNTNKRFQDVPLLGILERNWAFYKAARRSLKWHHDEHDSKELAQSTPPDSEEILIRCAWVTEAFTPSNIDSLYESLKNLGWDSDQGGRSDRNLVEWVQNARRTVTGFSWLNAGFIYSQKNQDGIVAMMGRYAPLPEGVEHAYLMLHNVTPTLTLFSIKFVFDNATSRILNSTLKEFYKTSVKFCRSGLRIKSANYYLPSMQKERAVQEQLRALDCRLARWFLKYLPGHFAQTDAAILPTIRLIT